MNCRNNAIRSGLERRAARSASVEKPMVVGAVVVLGVSKGAAGELGVVPLLGFAVPMGMLAPGSPVVEGELDTGLLGVPAQVV